MNRRSFLRGLLGAAGLAAVAPDLLAPEPRRFYSIPSGKVFVPEPVPLVAVSDALLEDAAINLWGPIAAPPRLSEDAMIYRALFGLSDEQATAMADRAAQGYRLRVPLNTSARDDSLAIQALIDKVTAKPDPRPEIVLTAGVYSLARPLVVPNGVSVVGAVAPDTFHTVG